jgi:hypothetical protein
MPCDIKGAPRQRVREGRKEEKGGKRRKRET